MLYVFGPNPFRMFVALMCAIHVRINGSVYLFIMANDEVDSCRLRWELAGFGAV